MIKIVHNLDRKYQIANTEQFLFYCYIIRFPQKERNTEMKCKNLANIIELKIVVFLSRKWTIVQIN